MTDEQIIKALECWINDFAGKTTQFVSLCNALALINRQKAEIERIENLSLQRHIAVVDFWVDEIDNLVKEFTEGG